MTELVVIYLWILSGYHVLSGAVSFCLPAVALALYRRLYGCEPPERRHLAVILRPWGALSVAMGIAGCAAAWDPAAARGTVLALAVLLALRLIYRWLWRELLAVSRVTVRRNLISSLPIAAGLVLLTAWLTLAWRG